MCIRDRFLEPDSDGSSGIGWVQFVNLGLKLPLMGSRVGAKVNVIHPALMAGPDFHVVPVHVLRAEAEQLRE